MQGLSVPCMAPAEVLAQVWPDSWLLELRVMPAPPRSAPSAFESVCFPIGSQTWELECPHCYCRFQIHFVEPRRIGRSGNGRGSGSMRKSLRDRYGEEAADNVRPRLNIHIDPRKAYPRYSAPVHTAKRSLSSTVVTVSALPSRAPRRLRKFPDGKPWEARGFPAVGAAIESERRWRHSR